MNEEGKEKENEGEPTWSTVGTKSSRRRQGSFEDEGALQNKICQKTRIETMQR